MMATLPCPDPSSSSVSSLSHHDKITTANFTSIPSWVSMKGKCSTSHGNHNKLELENFHLISLSKQGLLQEAHHFLTRNCVGSVNPQTYQSLFQACASFKSLSYGKLFHRTLFTTTTRVETPPSLFLQNCILQMYCDCRSLSDAQSLFDTMFVKDLLSWTILLSAYVQSGNLEEAFELFSHMQSSLNKPNLPIYNILLRPLAHPSFLRLAKQMHSHFIKSGLPTDISTDTVILNMYVKCGWLEGAKCVFEHMVDTNAVSWTAMMVGYSQSGNPEKAVQLFTRMLKESVQMDNFVFSIILKACSALELLSMGTQIHSHVVKLGLESRVSVGTPLVDLYAKCGDMDSSFRAFETLSEPSDVSWSAVISGYCQAGNFDKSLQLFQSLRNTGVITNPFIYTSIFQACSALADLNMGSQAHGDAIKRGLISCLYGDSAIITMYSKCGRLDYARQAFESIDDPDTIAWTAIISGCAYHGEASQALGLFTRMNEVGVVPNAVTFIAVLNACSHSGMVTKAKQVLDSMSSEYNVKPTIDHYDCMIDVYSRAGLLDEALELIKNMPFEPDAMSWKSLLGGCWTHGNVELGRIAADLLLRLDPEDTAPYIVMFNLYASAGKWEAAAHFRKLLVERNLRKEVSCSWISTRGKVHRFIVGDRHHPQTNEIYSKLEELNLSVTSRTLMNEDDLLSERKEQLLDHSEKLAIAFGLISTSNNSPILVLKNLRACKDCHEFGKKVSMITGREIVVRDASRFHHFKSGKCSCKDYW